MPQLKHHILIVQKTLIESQHFFFNVRKINDCYLACQFRYSYRYGKK